MAVASTWEAEYHYSFFSRIGQDYDAGLESEVLDN